MSMPRDAEPLFLTPAKAEMLRRLLDNLGEGVIEGEGRIVVGRRGGRTTVGLRKTPVQAPAGDGGGGFTSLVQVQLDTVFNIPGSGTTACAFRYFVYPPGVERTTENRIYPTSIQAYFRRWSIGEHEAARAGSLAELIDIGTTADGQGRTGPYLWLIPDERLRAEACT